MFKYKTEEELGKMTPEQRDIYAEQKREFEAKATEKMINDAIAKAIPDKKKEVEAVVKAKNPGKSEEEVKALVDAELKAEAELIPNLKKQLDEIKETFNQFKEGNSSSNNPMADIAKQLKENKDKIRKIAKVRGGSEEMVIKADTVRASVATNNHYLQIGGIGQLGRIETGIYDICTKYPVGKGNHNGNLAYTDWDEDSIVRNAAAVAEGVAFNESTAKFKGYTLSLRKIGDTLPVSEEFFEDEEMAAGELRGFLNTNVIVKRDYELVNGDNTGQHLKGLLASVPTYTASGADVQNPNIYDLFVKMRTAISVPRGSKYNNFSAVINQATADRLVLAKDANDQYLFPNQHPVWSLFRIDNNVPDNKMVVGDFRYARIYEMSGIVLSSGTTDTQFAEDLMTLKARLRLAFLIRTVDQTGFLLSADITTDLAAIKAA